MAISKTLLFWGLFMCSCFINNNNNGVEASHKVYMHLQSVKAFEVEPSYRTGYHFQPPANWINDPNGPMVYNGVYHLMYQYNPKGAVWGNIVWAHSISTDLINWIALEPAIYPTDPFDINGCWSGSATILPDNTPAIFYTGIDTQNRQVQNIAFPKNLSDPLLVEWVKPKYNPLIVPPNDVNISAFRDPTTVWFNNGHGKVLIGSRRKNRGVVWLYRSRDFKTWTKAQHPLHSAAKTGMWECPDFYPVALKGTEGKDWSVVGNNVKHVLKVSLDKTRFEYYTVGKYYPNKDRYVPDNTSADDSTGLRYDYGNFYASKTFFDKDNKRRILWGWANESDTSEQDVAKGWAGIQLIPRALWLDKNGRQLIQWPVKELENLRSNEISMSNVPLAKGGVIEVQGITASQADVEVKFHIPSLEKADAFDPSWVDAQTLCGLKEGLAGGVGPFGLLTLAYENLKEYTAVSFRVFKANDKHKVLMCSGGVRSSLRTEVFKPSFGGFVDVELDDGKLSLRSLIDNSVVESFGAGGKTCITSRVYPSLALKSNAHLYLFNNGTQTITMTKLNAWNMKRPKMN